ncbi:hypothetical protein JKP88DRAFT_241243 [Tribonema minus]|uniref:Uncharacterized protein n=1 Tax=Tribonema minus TaxID=303371 RepID=A0A835Z672_9STRA|nr:hypothetical protein JKP88DRAFT_241243 [Tribonema minus]
MAAEGRNDTGPRMAEFLQMTKRGDLPRDFDAYTRFLSPQTLSPEFPEHLRDMMYNLFALCHAVCFMVHRGKYVQAADWIPELSRLEIYLGGEGGDDGALRGFDPSLAILDDMSVARETMLDVLEESADSIGGELLNQYYKYCNNADLNRFWADWKLSQISQSIRRLYRCVPQHTITDVNL